MNKPIEVDKLTYALVILGVTLIIASLGTLAWVAWSG